jgi:hypothetical protein
MEDKKMFLINQHKYSLMSKFRSSLLGFLTFVCFSLSAQTFIQPFGKIDASIFENKICEFEPGAPAVVLLDECETTFEKGIYSIFYVHEKRRTRIHILDADGLSYAKIKIRFRARNRFESVEKISGITYNPNEEGEVSKTPLDKKDIVTRTVDKNNSETIFEMPGVKQGSVIEYSYEVIRQSFEAVSPWYFQHEIPTVISNYSIDIPDYFEFNAVLHVSEKMDKKKENTSSVITLDDGHSLQFTGIRSTYLMENLPGLDKEAFMSSRNDCWQQIRFRLSKINSPSSLAAPVLSTWRSLTQTLLNDNDFGGQLSELVVGVPKIKYAKKGDYEKMCAVYAQVKKQVQWNGEYTFLSLQGVNKTWKSGKGSSGDINLLLINCLRKAGLNAVPILASTHENGRIDTLVPLLEHFNQVLAKVVIKGRQYVLDASNSLLPPGLLPPNIIRNHVMELDNNRPRFMTLTDTVSKAVRNVVVMGSIDSSAVIHATAVIKDHGYSRVGCLKAWEDDKEEFKKSRYENVTIGKLTFENAENDSLPLIQNISFATQPSATGDNRTLQFSLLPEFRENPFVAKRRQSNIDFYYPREYYVQELFQLPSGYEVTNQPGKSVVVFHDNSIVMKRTLAYDAGSLNVRISIEFKRSFYPKEEYEGLKDFYKKMFDLLDEPIVLKKK